MNLLKRALAPITDDAWKEIDEQAKMTLTGNLCGRRLVDFCGPHGWEFSAVTLGGLTLQPDSLVSDVKCGLRNVQPLTEIRVPFSLNIWDLDNISRGSKTPSLEAVADAAHKAALFEEIAIYKGFKAGHITGLLEASEHAPISADMSPEKIANGIEEAVVKLQKSGISGPYALVLGTEPYKHVVASDKSGYPIKKRLEEILGGGIHWSPGISTGVVLSRRGGDFELCIGADISIGYDSHTTEVVNLYIAESFTFRVLEPAAAVGLEFTSSDK